MIKRQSVLFLILLFAVGSAKTMDSDSELTVGPLIPSGFTSNHSSEDEDNVQPYILYDREARPYNHKGYVFVYLGRMYDHIGHKEGKKIVAVAQANRSNCLANMSNQPILADDAWNCIMNANTGMRVALILRTINLDRINRDRNRAYNLYW